MAKEEKRFERIYTQGLGGDVQIWVDRNTGVQYLFFHDGYAGGLTPLLDADGKPVVEPVKGSGRQNSR